MQRGTGSPSGSLENEESAEKGHSDSATIPERTTELSFAEP